MTSRRPSLPPMPDLSHLTEDERKVIEDVLRRQREEEEKEHEVISKQSEWELRHLFIGHILVVLIFNHGVINTQKPRHGSLFTRFKKPP
ncbi:regulating synaptic membrane exocytosis protein 2 [Plakobranchus ocellatus]|uniref:Regulating synaptic membrane exocytosis protein 2 n=1 Tax=Plakobranchus ocellatus TaxID=259542 RepID=A0AAV3Z6I9_9GAST|nr:regulating synaptic membrane exocytosis protein 2 [Plakobranchus ocellatus]